MSTTSGTRLMTRLGAILALLAGLLTLGTSASAVTPAEPPGTPVAPAAPTGNVTVDPNFAPAQVVGADTTALARQSDDFVLVAGWFTTAGGGHFGLMRFIDDSTADPAFNSGLRFNDAVEVIVEQPDGKILVGGRFTAVNGQARRGIARLNGDGTLDATFNPGTGFANSAGEMAVHAIVVLPSGQVLVGGAFDSYRGIGRRGLVRLGATGALDADFDPMITGAGGPVAVHALTLQPDGKILVGGRFAEVSQTLRGGFARLNPNGTLDSTITGGWGFNAEVLTIAVQDDGKIVIGGAFDRFNTQAAHGLVRLHANGYRDFGLKAAFTKNGGRARVNTVITSLGSVVTVVGDFTECSGDRAVGIAGFTNSGSGFENYCDPDAFSGASVLPSSVHGRQHGPVAIAAGRYSFDVVAAGWVNEVHSLAYLVAWFGTHDAPSYPLMVTHRGFDGPVASMAVQSDGKVLVGGEFRDYNGTPVGRLVRLNSDGTLDTGFDANAAVPGPATTLSVLPDGKIVVVWDAWPNRVSRTQTVTRLLPNGAQDPAFTTTQYGSQWNDRGITALAVQPDGKLVLGGRFSVLEWGIIPDPRLVRLNANGGLDPTFTQVYLRPYESADVGGMVVQPDGGIVVVGAFDEAAGMRAAGIVRIGPTGEPDPRFAVGSGFGGSNGPGRQTAIVAQPDGKLVIGGPFTTFNGVVRNGILRLHSSGTLDTSFTPGTGFGSWTNPSALALQPDGKVLAAGSFTSFNGTLRRGLLRLNGDGSLDTGFDPGGGPNYASWIGAGESRPSLGLQVDGKLLLAGSLFGFNGAEPPPSGITRVVPPAPTVPEAPTIVVAMPGAGLVDVGFTAPSNDGGLPLTTYEYSVDGGPWLPRTPASLRSPIRIGGLTDGETYGLRLRGVNALGSGAATEPVTVRVGAPPASVLVPIAPARVSDSRSTSGGRGPLMPGETRVISVAKAQVGGAPVVPAGAVAVAYNITLPGPVGSGHVRVMPGDSPVLTAASAVNFRAGETIANAATVRASPDRTIKVHNGSGDPVDAVVDVVGYFVPAVAGAASAQMTPSNGVLGRFTAVTPMRVYDSAADPAGALPGGVTRVVSAATTQDGGTPVVPAGTSAVAFTVTVVDTPGAGHLRVMPGDVVSTPTSLLNWARPGERIANSSVVTVDEQRRLKVYNGSGAPVRFLVDVTGYYSAAGADFYPTEPVRVLETRATFGGLGPVAPVVAGVRTASVAATQVGSVPVVPDGAVAVAFNATVVATGSAGHLRVFPGDTAVPTASVLNWPGSGYTRANASTVGVSPAREVKVYNGAPTPTDVLIDINGYYK